jgi:hypothetical protein
MSEDVNIDDIERIFYKKKSEVGKLNKVRI